jgi:hypothetical protein
MSYNGCCKCNSIKYTVKYLPQEIADCHCSICQNLHGHPFVSFAKFPIKDIFFNSTNNFKKIKLTNKAIRVACVECDSILFMHYIKSKFIWLVCDTFNFDVKNIEHYDIFLNNK